VASHLPLLHVETTEAALENTQTHRDYQDYNMVSEVLEQFFNFSRVVCFLMFHTELELVIVVP